MDFFEGASVAKTAIDLAKTDNLMNKATGFLGMLMPYAGLEKTAVDLYIEEIKKSNLSPEAKAFYVLNTKKAIKQLKNQKNIADLAISNSKDNTDFSEKSGVNEEWLDRFMDSARFVSSEELLLKMGIGFDMINELETLGLLKFDAIAGYSIHGVTNKKLLICSRNNIDIIEEHKAGELPSGNVLLTSTGNALSSIVEEVNIDGYHDMIKNFFERRQVTFSTNHDYKFNMEGDDIVIF